MDNVLKSTYEWKGQGVSKIVDKYWKINIVLVKRLGDIVIALKFDVD